MPSLKDPTTRYATVIILIVSVWIYIAIVNEIQEIVNIPIYVLAVLLGISVLTAHKLLLRSGIDKTALDKAGSNPRTFIKISLGTMLGAVTAIVLAFLTTTLVDSDYRRELSSAFVTCAKDDSKIKGIPVDKSAALANGAELTVHNVVYNVPQRSDRPEEANSWHCAKATAVEVSVENILDDKKDAISIYDLKLKSVSPHSSMKSSLIGNESNTQLYRTNLVGKGSLPSLKLKFLPEGVTSSRGWLIYAVAENNDNKSSQFVYTKSGKSLVSIPLPN